MRHILLWLLLAFIWAASFPVIKVGVQTIPPITLVAGRMIVAALLLLLYVLVTQKKQVQSEQINTGKSVWIHCFFIGLVGNIIPFFLISWGEIHINSGLAAVLMGLTPMTTVFIAHLLFEDEPLSLNKLAGLFLGVGGLLILVGFNVFEGAQHQILGILSVAMAAICYAINTLYVKKFIHRPTPTIAFGSILVGAIVASPIAWFIERPLFVDVFSVSGLLSVFYLGIFATGLATIMYLYLIPRIGAGRMSQINFLVPVFGAFLGVIWLREPLNANLILALVTVLGAVYLVNFRHRK